jgi:hypothetical protein
MPVAPKKQSGRARTCRQPRGALTCQGRAGRPLSQRDTMHGDHAADGGATRGDNQAMSLADDPTQPPQERPRAAPAAEGVPSQRVAAPVKHLHWSTIAVDFLIVVVGVFIGMQASNWNQQRTANQQSAVFTARLKADMREADWDYQFLLIYSREVLVNANRAANALDGTAPLSDEALLISAYRATQYKENLVRNSTYEELISTGNIGLIRDQNLRNTAIRFYKNPGLDNISREGEQSHYREAFRMSLPNDVQRALGAHCGDRYIVPGDPAAIHGMRLLDYPCHTGLSAQVIAASARTLRTNPNLLPYLRLRIADIATRVGDLTGNNRDLMVNLRAIADEKP